jgi:hypothetical protein
MPVTQGVTDEITPIAVYIAHEMNTNAHGADAQRMYELNTFSSTKCIAEYQRLEWWRQLLGAGITPQQCVKYEITFPQAALLAWTAKVMQGSDWDHKTTIPVKFHPRDPKAQHWHLYGDTLYYYDVWSNLHYGYVGAAAGFSDAALLDGAGLEQFGSDVLRGRLPQRTGKGTALRNTIDRKTGQLSRWASGCSIAVPNMSAPRKS